MHTKEAASQPDNKEEVLFRHTLFASGGNQVTRANIPADCQESELPLSAFFSIRDRRKDYIVRCRTVCNDRWLDCEYGIQVTQVSYTDPVTNL